MNRILLACDLDNTLLHSHRLRQAGDVCIEWFEGREQSFLDPAACRLLPQVLQALCLVPVTTRSVEQYRRIRWPAGCTPALALAANGAVLLRGGEPDQAWQGTDCAVPYLPELKRLHALLAEEGGYRACRIVDGAYLFAAWEAEEEALQCAGKHPTSLTAAVSGRKVYFLPPGVDKGLALRRLQAALDASRVLAAGDSQLDLSMLNAAHLALVPDSRLARQVEGAVAVCPPGERFAHFILDTALAEAR
ncbi:MAG: HAD family hydrolase [Oscillospiraceae bacterium]|nr:HAD family hydrolase [Oscillospiraceae bacterium]